VRSSGVHPASLIRRRARANDKGRDGARI